jgi:hypothetical protein
MSRIVVAEVRVPFFFDDDSYNSVVPPAVKRGFFNENSDASANPSNGNTAYVAADCAKARRS